MKKLVTMLGGAAVLMFGLNPLGASAADAPIMVRIPVWNFEGTWSGLANIMTDDASLGTNGYLQDVAVTLVVPRHSQTVDPNTGMAYFKTVVTYGPPFGTGGSFDLLAAVKTKAPSRRKQDAEVMWSGDGVMGCTMGTTIYLHDPTQPDPMLLHGCMHFTSDALATGPNAAIVTSPAMAIMDVEKQQSP